MRRYPVTYLIFFFLLICFEAGSQSLSLALAATPEGCEKGTAALSITGGNNGDTTEITWSTGETNARFIDNIPKGDHFVRVVIRNGASRTDTTISFNIEKKFCTVYIPKYFSPNGDNYNDELRITNIGYWPEFDLQIFNKWGQRVHHQESKYEPWDGKWLGLDLPDGNYYYVLLYAPGKLKDVLSGDITILR